MFVPGGQLLELEVDSRQQGQRARTHAGQTLSAVLESHSSWSQLLADLLASTWLRPTEPCQTSTPGTIDQELTGAAASARGRRFVLLTRWQHIIFLREMTSWPPIGNYDVKSKLRLRSRCVFALTTFLLNSIPI